MMVFERHSVPNWQRTMPDAMDADISFDKKKVDEYRRREAVC
jgi:hypothetical protein